MTSLLHGAVCVSLLVLLASCSKTTVVKPLEGRLPATPGGTDYQAYYDPNLDITWTGDANLIARRNWDEQVAWVNTLTIGGIDGWRLPNMDVNGDGKIVNCVEDNKSYCTDNEYAYLYWIEGITASSPGPFRGVQNWYYNSGTDPGEGHHPRCFLFSTGYNGSCVPETRVHGWAVHDGDIASSPANAAHFLSVPALFRLVSIPAPRAS